MSAPTTARSAFLTLSLLAAVALPGAARASHANEHEIPPSYTALMKIEPKKVMEMMDVGKKGYVTRDEFVRFQEALFDKLDGNGDRKLTAPEFTDRG